jgi:hypothetical protein
MYLQDAYLSGAYENEAHLLQAYQEAHLRGANLSGANLSGVNLGGVNLSGANLSGANLSEARVSWSIFGNVDLSQVKGLESVHHTGPSTIGIDTIYLSGETSRRNFCAGPARRISSSPTSSPW